MGFVRLMAGSGLALALVVVAAGATGGAPDDMPGDPAKGRQVYGQSVPQCSLCHTVRGRGGKLGPDLSKVGATRSAAWLTRFLPDPRALDPRSKMPPVAAKGQDLEDLVAYLMTLKGR